MVAKLSHRSRSLVKAGIDLLIAAPVVGDLIYDELFKRSLRLGRRNMLHTPDELRKVFTDVISDLRPTVRGPVTFFEAGVYAGESHALWHEVAGELSVETRSYGADSFQGLPESVRHDEGGWAPGLFRCSRRVAEWNLRRLGAPLDRITLVEGWFDDTLTPGLARTVGEVHAAMIDADAYSSTVLRFLTPLLTSPSYLIFDDWYSGDNLDTVTGRSLGRGVERAFDEWHDAHPQWAARPTADYDLVQGGRTWRVGHVLRLERTG